MSRLSNHDAGPVAESSGSCRFGVRGMAAAWRFTMLRLFVFVTVTSAALAAAKAAPRAALIPALLWLIVSLLCLRAGDTRDTVRLLKTAFGVFFLILIASCLFLAALSL